MAENNPADPTSSNASTPAAKSRKRRRWPWVIVTLFLLLILLVLLAPTLLSTGPAKSMVLSKVNGYLNGKLDVKEISIGWTSGVTLDSVKIDDDQGATVVEISKIRIPISLIGAARGNFDLGDTVIDKPNLVRFIRYPDGTTNIDKLVKQQVDQVSDRAKPANKEPGQPSKLPNVKGKITINEARANITVLPNPGEELIPPVEVDPSNIVIEIPGINDPIKNKIDIHYRVGGGAPGTIAMEGTVKAIENNVVNIDKLQADQNLRIENANLAAAEPFLQSPASKTTLAGIANGALQIKASGLQSAGADGKITIANFAYGGDALKGDVYKSATVSIPIKLTSTTSGNDTVFKIETIKIETDHVLVDVSGQAPQQALQNAAANKPPGGDGQLAIALSTKDLPGLVNLLPNTIGLQKDVKIISGDFKTRVDVTLAKDRTLVKQVLDATAAGTNAGKPVKLDPVHLDSAITALPTASGSIPDLRDIALNLTSAFATAKGGGASLAALNITGDMDLARLRQQLGQFMEFGTLDFAGTANFAVTSKGDLTGPGGTSDVTANLNLANVIVRGLKDKPEMNQPRLALTTAATLVRGGEGQDFIERVKAATVSLQTGEAASPVVDMLLSAANVLPAKKSVERFELQKLNVPDLGRAQQQFAAFLPADMLLSGNLTATAAGAYRDDTATFDALAINTSEKLITLNKAGQGPLVVQLKNGAVGGNGELAVSSDLKRLDNVLKIFGSQLQTGVFAATVKLAGQPNAPTSIQLDGGIDKLSILTNEAPLQNEKVTLTVKANTPADFTSIAVDSAVINSSFAKTTITETRVKLGGGPLSMVEKAKVQIAIPDINKTMAVAQAFAPPSTQPAVPSTQPVEPLRIGGGAVVNLDIARDAATNTLRINIPEMAASKVSLARGKRSYAFDKVIALKLVAELATETVSTSASTQPTEQIRQVRVAQLSGDLGGLATLSMPQPITVTNLSSASPSANGQIALSGVIEPLMRMLSVVQDADPMPYQGSYEVAQNVTSNAGQLQLSGNATVNKLVVISNGKPAFSEDKVVVTNDLVADTNAKRAQIRNVSLNMTSSQAAGVVIKGTVDQWDTQRKLDGVTLDLSYDLAKIWQIVKPMLSPEQQKSYEDMKLAGVYKRTFNVSGSYPATANNQPAEFNQSIKYLSADGAFAFDQLATNGLDIGKYELPITLRDGHVSTLYANKPKDQRAPVPAPCNGTGKLDLGSIDVDLTAPDPLLSIGKNQQLLSEVPLNPVLADRIGKYASFLFKDSSQASGLMSVTVLECDRVPLGELIQKPNSGKAKVVMAVRDLRLDGAVARALGQVAQLGSEGIVGEVRDSSVTYANGQTVSDVSIFLTRKGTQVPLRFTGGIGLANLSLRDAVFSIPPELFGNDELVRAFPGGIKLPVTGTTEKYKIASLASIAKQNLPGVLGGVLQDALGGKKKDEPRQGTTTKPAPSPEPSRDPLGGLLDQLGGLKKKEAKPAETPPPAPAPAPAPAKKKKK
jgi:hypothetical protein